MTKHSLFLAALLAATVGTSLPAFADYRSNGLEDQPAVRHRRLLVKGRFEVTPLFESSVDSPYQNTLGGGLKLEYHLTDMWSIGAVGIGSTSIKTSLTNRIVPTLPTSPVMNSKDPTQDQFLDHLNSMPFHGAAYVSLTPWYGKLAAFSQAYVAFDFYFQAGLAFASLTSSCPAMKNGQPDCSDMHPGQTYMDSSGNTIGPDLNPNNDPPLNDGQRLGLYLGGGIHVYLSDFLALDLTVRDYAFSDNPSGADYNANLAVGSDDSRFIHHLFFGAGLAIMFPTTVKRTP